MSIRHYMEALLGLLYPQERFCLCCKRPMPDEPANMPEENTPQATTSRVSTHAGTSLNPEAALKSQETQEAFNSQEAPNSQAASTTLPASQQTSPFQYGSSQKIGSQFAEETGLCDQMPQ